MTKRMTAEMRTRCELALMGKVVPVHSNDEVNLMTKYILKVLDKEFISDFDILETAINKYSEKTVTHLVVNKMFQEFDCITYCLETSDLPKPFKEDYGTGKPCSFCYVFNTTVEYMSEFGDCFFEKRADGFFHRFA